MTETTPQQRVPEWDRLTIDGKAVITREAATQTTPISGGKPVPLTHVEKVLLDDGSEVHQCRKCGWWDPNALSVRAHLASHSPHPRRTVAKGVRTAKQRSAAGTAANEARRNRHAAIAGAGGPAAYLLQLGDVLEGAAKMVREIAREIARQIAAAQGPEITEDELASLRERATKWDRFVAARDAQ